ncbi:class I SAM-dependent methyltransferase [Saccharospirillum salsuginis]|uniref:Ribosomal RNA small subunit methyltransferase J n=1 Tax=Saccharospirillum salsuginis TaxID=418750 RepID=A0A918KJX2_9GAMM|nr:class I SAM-dependent methyltransferase [Saccharospirillum salsuginis]GGX64474.1 ribosomal RNA small subunit methyltransferase J [Saccharospirillum salsuginis]
MIDCYLPDGEDLNTLQPITREALAAWGGCVTHRPEGLYLTVTDGALGLAHADTPRQKPVVVDFLAGKARHRQQHGGGRSQAIAKAVGLAQNPALTILDATAGLGRDAFVLAGLGARVWLLERHPVVRLLLQDGLARGRQGQPELFDRMTLLDGDLSDRADALPEPDVVYLDPMFPERRSKAAVKKDMALFHELVGADEDADRLLAPALSLAARRVVVKRPRVAPPLAGQAPTYSLTGKSNRFDIYALRSISD